MPELPARQPWKRCLYCDKFDLWEGTLAVCSARKMVLSPQAHYNTAATHGCPTITADTDLIGQLSH